MAEETNIPGGAVVGLYDLLGRILPGAVLIIGVLWARQQALDAVARTVGLSDAAGMYGAFICLSFLAGLLLTALAGALFEVILQILSKWFLPLALITAERSWQRIDRIGRINTAAGNVLAKISGEVQLCQNLLVAILVITFTSTRSLRSSSVLITCSVILFAWVTRVIALRHRIDSLEQTWENNP